MPFGEEIGGAQVALLGSRTSGQGYTSDSMRQHFTGYELDAETGLNFAQARYQSSVQGRFTSVDPLGASANIGNPQSFNRYSYVNNNPVNLNDPSGMMTPNPATGMVQTDDESYARTLQGSSDAEFQQEVRDQHGKGDRAPGGTEGKVDGTELTGVDNNSVGTVALADASLGSPQDPVVVNGHIIEDPITPCHIMADVAQNEANTALYQNPGDHAAALAQFDRSFSTMYVGGPFTSSYQAYRWRGGMEEQLIVTTLSPGAMDFVTSSKTVDATQIH